MRMQWSLRLIAAVAIGLVSARRAGIGISLEILAMTHPGHCLRA